MKKIWIIGASSGIGLELVKLWLNEGNYVVASARSATSSKELVSLMFQYESKLSLVNCNINEEESLKEASKRAVESFGHLDVLFFNAAIYNSFSIDNLDIAKYENMINTNYLGAIKVIKEALPYFENKKDSNWYFNCSLSSYFGLPYGSAYSSSKAALVNLIESLHPELKTKNINAHIINHGFVNTRLTKKNDFDMPQLLEPEDAAIFINKGMQSNSFEIRFPFKLALFLRILRVLPYFLSLKITKGFLK